MVNVNLYSITVTKSLTTNICQEHNRTKNWFRGLVCLCYLAREWVRPILQLLGPTWGTLMATVIQLKLTLLITELLSSALAIHQNNPVENKSLYRTVR